MGSCSLCHGSRLTVVPRDTLGRIPTLTWLSTRPQQRSRHWVKTPVIKPLFLRSNPLEKVAKTVQDERRLESVKIPSEIRLKVESAVEQQGNRVTAGDVSGRVGVTLAEADDALKAIAADSLGTLEVSNEGEVVYVFPNDFRNRIRSKSFLLRMEPRMKAVAQTAAWTGRVAFGIFFIGTVIAVWVAVFVVASSGDKDSNRSNRSSHGGGWINLFDVFRLMLYMDARRSYDNYERRKDEMSFWEAVYSYMFGDGDPNDRFDDLRWNLIGNYIKSNGGVVVAEELAPFLDVPEGSFEASMVIDEGYMLPVLTRFEGEPTVNDRGHLVYCFPKLQTTGSASMRRTIPKASYLSEATWQFSKAGTGQLGLVIAFAVANVIGVGILSEAVRQQLATGALIAPGLPYVMFALQLYAWSFFIIPVCRWLLNRRRNAVIKERNQLRSVSATRLKYRSRELEEKISNARKMAKRKFVGLKDLVYSSSGDMEEQTKKWEEEDFDKRLKQIGQN